MVDFGTGNNLGIVVLVQSTNIWGLRSQKLCLSSTLSLGVIPLPNSMARAKCLRGMPGKPMRM